MGLGDFLRDDPRQEIAYLVTLGVATALRVMDKLGDWPYVALMGVALVTLLGTAYFAGLKVGRDGFEVKTTTKYPDLPSSDKLHRAIREEHAGRDRDN